MLMENNPRKTTLIHTGNTPDIRSVGAHPNNWYPLAQVKNLKTRRPHPVSFAGEKIIIVRTENGSLFALEDRCAHRQVPLSKGVVSGESIRCGYHGWTFDGSGKCVGVPYLDKGQPLPDGVRSYPCREAYGFIFVYPGDPTLATDQNFPAVPSQLDPIYKTRYLDRVIRCHYSFMHENLMDMNHQFLHRRLMGGVRPTLLEQSRGEDWNQEIFPVIRSLREVLIQQGIPIPERSDHT